MAYLEIYANQEKKKKSFKSSMCRLTFCHARGIAIISEVTEMSNTIILCMYVLSIYFFTIIVFLISYFEFAIRNQIHCWTIINDF